MFAFVADVTQTKKRDFAIGNITQIFYNTYYQIYISNIFDVFYVVLVYICVLYMQCYGISAYF